MCLTNKIQQTLAEIAERQERLAKLQSLEQKTNPTMQALYDLLEMYREVSPSDMPDLIAEITTACSNYQKLIEPQCQQQLEIVPELEKLSQEAQKEVLTGEVYNRVAEEKFALDDEPKIENESAVKPTIAKEVKAMFDHAYESFGVSPKNVVAENKPAIKHDWRKDGTCTGCGFVHEPGQNTLCDYYIAPNLESQYEPDEAYDTVDSILKSTGFQHPKQFFTFWDASDKYDNYRGWDVYFSVPNGGIVAIGLHYATQPESQAWDAATEFIQKLDLTFPESLADFDEIVAWTRQLIDQVENLEAPGQQVLPLEFSEVVTETESDVLTGEAYDRAVEEELALDDEAERILRERSSTTVPGVELTALQKLLADNSNFTFEELGVSVALESIIAPADDIVDFESEEVRVTVTDATGTTREYSDSARTFVYQRHPDSVEQAALDYANYFLKDLKEEAKTKEKIARWNADETLQSSQQSSQSVELESVKSETDTKFEVMGFAVQVYPQYGESNLVGATFRFMSLEEKDTQGKPKLVFSTSRLAAEIGDVTYKIFAEKLIVDYQAKEAERLEKLANPHAKEEDKFVELVKITSCVGYLKQRGDNGEVLAGYAAFSNKDEAGQQTPTKAKNRAQKWTDFLRGNYKASEAGENLDWDAINAMISEPRKSKRLTSDNPKLEFVYEIEFTDVPLDYLERLAQQDLSLLPGQIASTSVKDAEAIKETIKTDKESLTEHELTIVKLIQDALLKFDAELIKSTNVTAWKIADRTQVWNALTEEEQKIYELLLKLEFTQALDFSAQTPEFITRVDGKQGKSVFLTLRVIDGETRTVWRYQRQTGDGGYPSKQAAAVAAWLQ
jgi:hypothetical protein